LAGNGCQAVYIQTVGNLAPSNALPAEFNKLRSTIEAKEVKAEQSVHSSASTGTALVLLVAGLSIVLVLGLVFTTIRSIMSGVKFVRDRFDALKPRERSPRRSSTWRRVQNARCR
jgi:hypothetical protein